MRKKGGEWKVVGGKERVRGKVQSAKNPSNPRVWGSRLALVAIVDEERAHHLVSSNEIHSRTSLPPKVANFLGRKRGKREMKKKTCRVRLVLSMLSLFGLPEFGLPSGF